jgi:hypothetical protein
VIAMTLLLRLGVVSCGFYLAGVVLLAGACELLSLWRGHFGVDATRTGWTLLYGFIWLLAFQLSWRFVVVRLLASRRF